MASGESSDRRFPRRVFSLGTEPDPRFTLANERTFLAWIRTSLAAIAGGVALGSLELPLQPGLKLAASLVLLVLGIGLPVVAWRSWMATESAMRIGAALPTSHASGVLAAAVGLVGVLVLLGVLLGGAG